MPVSTPYKLTTPCKRCPFRTDVTPFLRRERAKEIAGSIRVSGDFPCHKTTVPTDDGEDMQKAPDSQQCAGALIIQEREGNLGQAPRIAERLGIYDPARLAMDAPVFDTFTAFIRAQEGGAPDTVTTDNGEVLELEHCGVVGPDCEDPAGYSGSGGVHENDDEPTCDPRVTCQYCGNAMCPACRGQDVDGYPVCSLCEEEGD